MEDGDPDLPNCPSVLQGTLGFPGNAEDPLGDWWQDWNYDSETTECCRVICLTVNSLFQHSSQQMYSGWWLNYKITMKFSFFLIVLSVFIRNGKGIYIFRQCPAVPFPTTSLGISPILSLITNINFQCWFFFQCYQAWVFVEYLQEGDLHNLSLVTCLVYPAKKERYCVSLITCFHIFFNHTYPSKDYSLPLVTLFPCCFLLPFLAPFISSHASTVALWTNFLNTGCSEKPFWIYINCFCFTCSYISHIFILKNLVFQVLDAGMNIVWPLPGNPQVSLNLFHVFFPVTLLFCVYSALAHYYTL